MARIIYQKPIDQVADNASVVTVSSENAAYPKANLSDGNPAKPFKFTATTGNIVWDFGSAQSLDIFAIIHHNLTAALANVKIQGNATDSWGAPSLDQAVVIPAYRDDGYPRNPWVDLSGIGSRSFRYWRLVFGTANGANIALGEVWLGALKRSLTHNISWGYDKGVIRPSIVHRTRYGVKLTYDLAAPRQYIKGPVQTSDAGAEAMRDLFDATRGQTGRFLVVEDPLINDAMIMEWTSDEFKMQREFANNVHLNLDWEEASRGLVL